PEGILGNRFGKNDEIRSAEQFVTVCNSRAEGCNVVVGNAKGNAIAFLKKELLADRFRNGSQMIRMNGAAKFVTLSGGRQESGFHKVIRRRDRNGWVKRAGDRCRWEPYQPSRFIRGTPRGFQGD